MKFMSLFRLLLVLTPLSLTPAAERLPEFSSTAVYAPAVDVVAVPPPPQPVPEVTSWSLLMGAIGSFLLIRKRY